MSRLVQFGVSLLGATLALCGAARAADLRADAPTHEAAAPVAPWSGLYFGGYAGGAFGGAAQSLVATSAFLTANLPQLITFFGDEGSRPLTMRGLDLGVEAGYDLRVSGGFVLGLAGDINWSNLSGSRVSSGNLPVLQFPYALSQSLSSDWRGALRVRGGVTPLDNVLVYATGGLAFGRFNYSSGYWDQLTPPFQPGSETENTVLRGWRAGWTLGAGAEWALSRNWSIKGEYRFTQYAGVSGLGVLQLQQPPSPVDISHAAGPIRVNTLRIGLDYHFN